jgi:hypothetical protein
MLGVRLVNLIEAKTLAEAFEAGVARRWPHGNPIGGGTMRSKTRSRGRSIRGTTVTP